MHTIQRKQSQNVTKLKSRPPTRPTHHLYRSSLEWKHTQIAWCNRCIRQKSCIWRTAYVQNLTYMPSRNVRRTTKTITPVSCVYTSLRNLNDSPAYVKSACNVEM